MDQPRETIMLQQLTLAQAAAQFPGCDDEDAKELLAQPPIPGEPEYLRFFLYEGRLLSCTYEISYLGWSEWKDGYWRDLDDADNDLFCRFEEADFEFLPAAT